MSLSFLDENGFGVHFHHSMSNECEVVSPTLDAPIVIHPKGNRLCCNLKFNYNRRYKLNGNYRFSIEIHKLWFGLGISLVTTSESSTPPINAICHGKEEYDIDLDGDLRLWTILAHTPHGRTPGYNCL